MQGVYLRGVNAKLLFVSVGQRNLPEWAGCMQAYAIIPHNRHRPRDHQAKVRLGPGLESTQEAAAVRAPQQ